MNRYRNFDVELTDYGGGSGARETFRLRVALSPAGEQRHGEAVQVELDPELREACGRLDRRELDLAGLLRLGKTLGELLLPEAARSYWDRSRAALEEDEGIRLRLKLDSWALADIPWEYVWLPARGGTPGQEDASGFLALDTRVSLVRYELLGEPVGSLDSIGEGPLHLVAVMASPESPDLPSLDLRREAVALRRALEARPDVDLEVLTEGSLPALERALQRGAHMFHFSGHGRFAPTMTAKPGTVEGRGFLVFEDGNRRPVEVAADTLVVNLRGRGVRLAVLGSCLGARRDPGNPWLGIAPALVRSGLPAVVAMQATLLDESAIAFSAQCYETLVKGGSIDDAVTAGRVAIFNQGGPTQRDWGVAVLYLRSDSGVLFPRPEELRPDVVPPLNRRGWINVALSAAAVAMLLAAYYLFGQTRIPSRWLLGSGLSVAAVLVGIVTWLMWLAGDDVRSWVRRLLVRRRMTMGLTAAALAFAAAAVALHLESPVVVRVIPWTQLTQRLPEPGPKTTIPFAYTLRAWQGDHRDPDWVLRDLRMSGGVLGTSDWVEAVVLEREEDAVRARLRKHLSRLPPQYNNASREEYLELWSAGDPARPVPAGPRRRAGAPLRFELVKMRRGTAVEVERQPLQCQVELENGVEIVIVELQNARPPTS